MYDIFLFCKAHCTLNKLPTFRFTDEQLETFFFQTVSFVNLFVKSVFFHLPITNTPIHRYNLLNLTLC